MFLTDFFFSSLFATMLGSPAGLETCISLFYLSSAFKELCSLLSFSYVVANCELVSDLHD